MTKNSDSPWRNFPPPEEEVEILKEMMEDIKKKNKEFLKYCDEVLGLRSQNMMSYKLGEDSDKPKDI